MSEKLPRAMSQLLQLMTTCLLLGPPICVGRFLLGLQTSELNHLTCLIPQLVSVAMVPSVLQ